MTSIWSWIWLDLLILRWCWHIHCWAEFDLKRSAWEAWWWKAEFRASKEWAPFPRKGSFANALVNFQTSFFSLLKWPLVLWSGFLIDRRVRWFRLMSHQVPSSVLPKMTDFGKLGSQFRVPLFKGAPPWKGRFFPLAWLFSSGKLPTLILIIRWLLWQMLMLAVAFPRSTWAEKVILGSLLSFISIWRSKRRAPFFWKGSFFLELRR